MEKEPRKVLENIYAEKEYMDKRVSEGIEKNRKGDIKIRITGNGKPLSGTKIKVTQTTHDFHYGANIFMLDQFENEEKNKLYRKYFGESFNIATLPFYWNDLEPEPGKLRFSKDSENIYRRPNIELCMEYCRENNIEPKVHCLNYSNFYPNWVPKDDVKEEKRLLEKRFKELSEVYGDQIRLWEVTNETYWCSNLYKRPAFYSEDNFVEWSFQKADKYFQRNSLMINEAAMVWDWGGCNRNPYYMQIERALKNGCRIDEIGIQFHMFYRREAELAKTKSYYNPRNILGVLDKFAEFKKPVQITEITFPAYSESSEDEEIQAEILKNVYSMWFSHEAVSGIIYWNLVDGYAAYAPQGDMTAGENYYYGGLFRFDFTPKPAYFMLRDLFENKWRTREVLTSDENGEIALRGFYGSYELEAEIDGKVYSVSVHHKKGEKSEFEICADE